MYPFFAILNFKKKKQIKGRGKPLDWHHSQLQQALLLIVYLYRGITIACWHGERDILGIPHSPSHLLN